ncbi:ATP-binding protein [Chryseobacterium sp.]|uniref:ATP-binding protein n=1 Tax=Chryseobacterium sp. TaxID=1871047 RepID=UPI00289CE733|nr:ATP-binding protein [Chryseobacterium sp.]
MDISTELKEAISLAILHDRTRYSGSDTAYSKTLGINSAVFSRLKKGEREGLLSQGQWLNIGRKLQVNINESAWQAVETDVYLELQDDFSFCQNNSKSLILVDDCGIGKTFCARIIIAKMNNAFYIDASQHKTKRQLIKALAKEIGSGTEGTYNEILANLKYYINVLGNVFICIDEAGDLDYSAFLELKGLINGTVARCGWYLMGAEGLRAKINRGINNQRVGFKEIFDRFSTEYRTIVPVGGDDRRTFYQKLLTDVATANTGTAKEAHQNVKKCIAKGKSLRYLETLIIIEKAA